MSRVRPVRVAAQARDLARWGRGLPRVVVDAVIAVACYLTLVVYATAGDRLDWWVLALAAANAVPLMWRRRFPLLVTVVVGVSTTGLALIDALGHIPAGQLVATYTFAAICPPLRRLVGVLGTVVGISVSILIPDEPVLVLGPAGIMFAVAYALGVSARARQDRIAMLEERARRHAEEQAATAAQERARIAREMHDILAHSMGLVVVQAEAGPVAVRTDPDKAEEVFDTISATAREALSQLRRTLGVLRSGAPDRHPHPALEGLDDLVTTARQAGLTATLQADGQPRPVPPTSPPPRTGSSRSP